MIRATERCAQLAEHAFVNADAFSIINLSMSLDTQSIDNAAQWDQFACAHPHGHLLQRWAWGELKARYGWTPVRVALTDGVQLVAGAQILFRRLPLGLGAMGYVPKGPVIALDSPYWPDLLAAMQQVARTGRAAFVRLEPEWELGHAPSLPMLRRQPDSAIVQAPATIMVDLRPPPDEILAQMHQKWRYNIRLAERKNICVRIGDESDLTTFHRLSQITSERDGFPIRTAEYYRAAYQLFKHNEAVALFMAEYEGKPLAAIIVFICGRMAIYLYGASSDEERNRMPNHILQWRAMRWAKERGCEVYDLWGVPDLGDGGRGTGDGATTTERSTNLPEGLLRFKEGFGGRLVRYAGAFDIVYQPVMYRALNWLIEKRRERRGVASD